MQNQKSRLLVTLCNQVGGSCNIFSAQQGSHLYHSFAKLPQVAPVTEAWIEIREQQSGSHLTSRMFTIYIIKKRKSFLKSALQFNTVPVMFASSASLLTSQDKSVFLYPPSHWYCPSLHTCIFFFCWQSCFHLFSSCSTLCCFFVN